jgi:hypothetical protein
MQKLKQKLKFLPLILLALMAMAAPASVMAATSPACQKFLGPDGNPTTISQQCESQTPAACKGINRFSDAGESKFDDCLSQKALVSSNNPIIRDLNTIVDFLSGLVGIVVVGVIILGGIQYSMAGDSPDAVGKAKQRITNGLIALVGFLLIFSFLQWIIPGGIFNS